MKPFKDSIEYSRYTLVPKKEYSQLKPREGLFLKFLEGYTDFLPWPSLGQGTVDEALVSLRSAISLTDLSRPLQIALSLAQLESRAKAEMRNLTHELRECLEALSEPLRSYSFGGTLVDFIKSPLKNIPLEKSFSSQTEIVKLKAHSMSDYGALKECLDRVAGKNLKLIVDGNGSLSIPDLEIILESLTTAEKKHIAYFEDPTQINHDSDLQCWSELSAKYGVAMAADIVEKSLKTKIENRNDQGPAEFLYVIAKPWIEYVQDIVSSAVSSMRRVVFTNQMGHGFQSLLTLQLIAPQFVSDPLALEPMGLKSGECWNDPWGFSNVLKFRAGGEIQIQEMKGYGWGLDPIWEKLEWKKL